MKRQRANRNRADRSRGTEAFGNLLPQDESFQVPESPASAGTKGFWRTCSGGVAGATRLVVPRRGLRRKPFIEAGGNGAALAAALILVGFDGQKNLL